jgi:gamma-glutamyltranspeptidase / glutathione hydrolase
VETDVVAHRSWPYLPNVYQHFASSIDPLLTETTMRELVLTYHPRATRIGLATLRAGGNAFDAFVAATMAEYVLAEGGTSMAGLLGALVYDAETKAVEYLDADFNNVAHPDGIWTLDEPDPGKAVPVPGAIAGLEALANRFGSKKFAELIKPALDLARDGFPINNFYASMIAWRARVLRASQYGRKTYFPQGKALKSGDTLRQPELAVFLSGLRRHGAAYMYRGEWAKEFVRTVRRHKGLVTLKDLASYKVAWRKPLKAKYRNFDLYTTSGRNFGGLWTLLALKTLENTDIAKLGHFSTSANALEILVRTAREVWAELWIFDYCHLDNQKFLESRLTAKYTAKIWSRVARALPRKPMRKTASHSYHIIVVDKKGNAVTGTNTFQQTLPWGQGLFVQGVFLPDVRLDIGYPVAAPAGSRRVNGLTMHMVFDKSGLRFLSGTIGDSLVESSLQFLINLIDYRMNAQEAVSAPGFGTFPHDVNLLNTDWTSNWLSPRTHRKIVQRLKKRGLYFRQQGPLLGKGVDAGLGGVAIVHPNGTVDGQTAPWPGLSDRRGASRDAPRRGR